MDGTIKFLQQSPCGLYYTDTSPEAVVSVNTEEDNKSGQPSTQLFIEIVDKNLLSNCPITRRDILIAEDIFGTDVGSLEIKTARHSQYWAC
jgi:hypothetical protein